MAKTGSFINSMVKDKNQESVQIGSSFQTADATATPQNSPLTYTGSVTTIVVPDNAVEFIVNPSTAMRVSEVVGMGTYDVIASGSKESIPCARMQNIYIKQDSAGGTLNFRFTLI